MAKKSAQTRKFEKELFQLSKSIYKEFNDLSTEVHLLEQERKGIQKDYAVAKDNEALARKNGDRDIQKEARNKADEYNVQIRNINTRLKSLRAKVMNARKKADTEYAKQSIELQQKYSTAFRTEEAKKLAPALGIEKQSTLERKKEVLSNIKFLSEKQKVELEAIERQLKIRTTKKERKKSKEEEEIAQLLATMENSTFLKFIRKPSDVIGPAFQKHIQKSASLKWMTAKKDAFAKTPFAKGLAKANSKLGVGVKATNMFFKGSKIGKFVSFLSKPLLAGFSKILKKFIPWANLIDFILSPVGIGAILTLYALFKTFVWGPYIKPAWDWTKMVIGKISEVTKAVWDWTVNAWNWLTGPASAGKDSLAGIFALGWTNTKEWFTRQWENTKNWFNTWIINPIQELISRVKVGFNILRNIGQIVGSTVLNPIIDFINGSLISRLQDIQIAKWHPFEGIPEIPTVPKPKLTPEAEAFLNKAVATKPAQLAIRGAEAAKALMNARTTAEIQQTLENREQGQRAASDQVARAVEVMKTSNEEMTTIITNNKFNATQVNVQKKALDDDMSSFGAFDMTGGSFAYGG